MFTDPEDLHAWETCIKLLHQHARAPTAAALSGLSISEVRLIAKQIGLPPKGGLLPTDSDWFVRYGGIYHVWSSLFCSFYFGTTRLLVSPSHAFLDAWSASNALLPNIEKASIDRAYYLTKLVEWKEIELRRCTCGATYVAKPLHVKDDAQHCPLCVRHRSQKYGLLMAHFKSSETKRALKSTRAKQIL